MTMNDPAPGSMQSEINITPLIDVLLVLLIIFMVIVPVIPKGETASAPRPALHDQHPQPDAVVLEVLKDAQGNAEYRINRQEISRQDLPARLAAIYANRAQRVIFIRGDDQIGFARIAEAIDISHAAGIEQVGLLTPKVARGL